MFRLSYFIQELLQPGSQRRPGTTAGPVVIWNLIRRCNLLCQHCYSLSNDTDFKGELSTEEAKAVLLDLQQMGVPAVILSGGEPLLRGDIFELASYAKQLGLYTALSSNGTLIDAPMSQRIASVGFDYVGISIDGDENSHDAFRRQPGAYAASLRGVELCQQAGIKVGLRFTLTQHNAAALDHLLMLCERYQIDKFYLSHLNYAGRGNKNRGADAYHRTTRKVMERLFALAVEDQQQGRARQIVTGNNDADGVWLYLWARQHYPDRAEHLRDFLCAWGGNASGQDVANIDNLGNVHPDTFWWNHHLGNVREHPFSQIWRHSQDPLLLGLRQRPRPLQGRCQQCQHQAICNGNTRVRAAQLYGNPWAEDPGCYLQDAELGLPALTPLSLQEAR